ncbi:hypothetical protein Zmor_010422 [Zophobas morio]|uniref:Nuclease HARBI1 n=1 Tax=Zophobas morio TaxID=2755281 RepID=A0AA38IK98_9CUCU|nr:hypothetical protein Zmor_010422 [Zophobas morio]
MDENNFRKRFRLSRRCMPQVLQLIEDRLEFPFDTNNAVSPMNQLLICLRYYSTGGHLQAVVDFASTVKILLNLVKKNDVMQQRHQDFFEIASFPRVSGAIDYTHIKIQSPGGDDADIFRNRKGYFSINKQMVCNTDLRIINVVALRRIFIHNYFNNL